MLIGALVAQTTSVPSNGFDPFNINYVINYGVIALVLIAMVTGYLVRGRVWQAEKDRADSYEVYIRDKVVPLVNNVVTQLSENNKFLSDLQRKQATEDAIAAAMELLQRQHGSLHTQPPKGGAG